MISYGCHAYESDPLYSHVKELLQYSTPKKYAQYPGGFVF